MKEYNRQYPFLPAFSTSDISFEFCMVGQMVYLRVAKHSCKDV